MYAVTGITGKVGGAVARALLAAGLPVRAVVRDAAKGAPWAASGCEIAVAAFQQAEALQQAFTGAEGVFVVMPSIFDPAPGFPEARAIIATVRSALEAARPSKVVALSTIGANATQPNLLNQLGLLEQALGDLPMPVAFLRPAWFMENATLDVASAREMGVISSYLQPLDKPVPMVATDDVGRTAAEMLREAWTGKRIVELEGPRRVTPNDIAEAFTQALGRPVRTEIVPRARWEGLFRGRGMKNPAPRMQMIDGFNEGWIAFANGGANARKGVVSLETVIRALVEAAKRGERGEP